MENKQKDVAKFIEEAFSKGANGNEKEAIELIQKGLSILKTMTEEERGPILNRHYPNLVKIAMRA